MVCCTRQLFTRRHLWRALVGVGLLTANGELALCYVLPEARFNGIGTRLLEAVASHAQGSGLTEIRLNSTVTAKTFYLRNGFEPVGAPETECGLSVFPLVKRFGADNGVGEG